MVFLSDGEPSQGIDTFGEGSVDDFVERAKYLYNPDYGNPTGECCGTLGPNLVYTAAVTTEPDLLGYMAHWSSNDCDDRFRDGDCRTYDDATNPEDAEECNLGTGGRNYAYSASDASELSSIYEQIIVSITGQTLTYTTDVGTYEVQLLEGFDKPLPLPIDFHCEDEDDELVVPFRAAFDGEGTVNISDVQLQYCPL
jgi:hypothetical protein